ncbi:MAG: COX15/CtaA family protein [Proteobacteria bacterium]|nr:COX15/CtaA family protein [Pseudomonadota bacterium]
MGRCTLDGEAMFVYRFALLTAILTFALLLLGGVVHTTDSGLACPAWPLCFAEQDQLIPDEMGRKPAIEYSHRLLASAVGLATIALLAATVRARRRNPLPFRLAAVAAPLVVFQGVLGKITVENGLPTLVSTAHMATALVFFGLLLVIALRSHPGVERWYAASVPMPSRGSGADRGRRLFSLALGGLYAQMLLGALVRHSGAGLACGTDPLLCAGILWPPWGPGQLQMLHRAGAVVAAVLVLAAVWHLLRNRRDRLPLLPRVAARLAIGLVFVQIVLGMGSVMSALEIATVTSHMGLGILLFADVLLLWHAAGPLQATGASHTLGASHELPGGVTAGQPRAARALGPMLKTPPSLDSA